MKHMELLDQCNNPCFNGSRMTVNELFLSIFYLEKKFPKHLGDEVMYSNLNIFSSVFPDGNLIQLILKSYPSRRNLMRFITKAVSDLCKPLSVMEITVCKNGCMLLFPEIDKIITDCQKCGELRSSETPLFYLPVAERITRLLRSDFKAFFNYPEMRRKPLPGVIEDILDGSAWKSIKSQIPHGQHLIGIYICWDGADLFDNHGISFWPLTYFIVNLPLQYRYKFHVGMHIAYIDSGSNAALELFIDEMEYLWHNGIDIDGEIYKVAIIGCNFDTRGYEKFFGVQGIYLYYFYI